MIAIRSSDVFYIYFSKKLGDDFQGGDQDPNSPFVIKWEQFSIAFGRI